MEMTGEFRIPAPRQRVWEALNDPEILKQSIPGCQTLEKVSDTEFNGKVVASVGPVRATFGGKVTLSDLDPPQSYTISGEGSGGVAEKGGAVLCASRLDIRYCCAIVEVVRKSCDGSGEVPSGSAGSSRTSCDGSPPR